MKENGEVLTQQAGAAGVLEGSRPTIELVTSYKRDDIKEAQCGPCPPLGCGPTCTPNCSPACMPAHVPRPPCVPDCIPKLAPPPPKPPN